MQTQRKSSGKLTIDQISLLESMIEELDKVSTIKCSVAEMGLKALARQEAVQMLRNKLQYGTIDEQSQDWS